MARSKGSTFDPGGGTSRGDSYAERLRTNVNYDQRLKRNVLEIVLEKTGKDGIVAIIGTDFPIIFFPFLANLMWSQ